MRNAIVLAVILLGAAAFAFVRQDDDSTPEGCVRTFIGALNEKDLSKAITLVEGGLPKAAESMTGTNMMPDHCAVSGTHIFGTGDEVVVQADLAFDKAPTNVIHDLFRVKKIDAHWRIEPAFNANVASAPPSFLAAFLITDRAPAVAAAKSTVCLSNVKQLALANIMYKNDYDDRMPPSDNWKSDIDPYCKSKDIFHCPEDNRKGAVSYRMSEKLSKHLMTKIASPAETDMVYEGENGVFMARHEGLGSLGYADGHAKRVAPEAFKAGYHE